MSKHRSHHYNKVNKGVFKQPQRAGNSVDYHVLRCTPVINRDSPQIHNEHLQVLIEIESGNRYWMTINVRNGSDKVLYYVDEDYHHPITGKIFDLCLPQGFTKLDSNPDGIALDYIREKLFDFNKLVGLDGDSNSKSTDLSEILSTQLVNASRFQESRIYVFGSRFTDGERFSSYHLAEGIHDIHMNQGSVGGHAGSNGIYQDGGILIHFPTHNKWTAIFMKFESQAIQTDERGNSI